MKRFHNSTVAQLLSTFFLILESLSEIWASFDLFPRRCYNKRQGRKHGQVWRQNTPRKRVKFAHKNSIYLHYFPLNSQFMACSFSRCSPVKYTFSFKRASCAKSWNMAAKIAENDSSTSQVDQVLLPSPRGRDWERGQLSPHGWRARNFWSYKLCLARLLVDRSLLNAVHN